MNDGYWIIVYRTASYFFPLVWSMGQKENMSPPTVFLLSIMSVRLSVALVIHA